MSEQFATIVRALSAHITDSWTLINAADAVVEALNPTEVKTYDTHDDIVKAALASNEVMGFVADNKKIYAIKELRSITGRSLKETKDAVEDWRVWQHAPAVPDPYAY